VAVSDWMRAVPDQIAPFVPGTWSSLGTDGFGLSDTRRALRHHFGVDASSIVLRVIEQLVHSGALDRSAQREATQIYGPAEAPMRGPGHPNAAERSTP
jgi:pyruvate dehydrogenase E1 component